MKVRIANGAGFLGDWLAAPRQLVEQVEVDYLTLEYLAELTLSILARERQKDPQAGYARDFLDVVASICPALYLQGQLKLVTNAGGMNPHACAEQVAGLLAEHGLSNLPVAVVTGDDLLDRIETLAADGCELAHLDTGQPLVELQEEIVSANAYLGAAPITQALTQGARMAITGRVADASLTVGPAAYEFGWKPDQWNCLAGGSLAGHLIECGAQVTGGYSTRWNEHELTSVGYPIAEVESSGRATITKPPGSGGAVTRRTVVEQMVYEIGDPARYLTPDVELDMTTAEVVDHGHDRVEVSGATGRPAPSDYKVSIAYHAGYTASGQLLVYGQDCIEKAKQCAQIVLDRVEQAGFALDQSHVELLGTGSGVPGLVEPPESLREVMLRLTVRDPRREAVERFTKELAPLITSGPAGLAGYASGRSPVRPVFAYWPALVPKDQVRPRVEVRAASDWL